MEPDRVGRLRGTRRRLTQQLPKVCLQELGLLAQLAPGHADHMPTGGGEHAVPNAIPLEGLPRIVHGAAIELDYEALIWPDTVDLIALHALVRLGKWETRIEEECLEALFEFAADNPRPDARFRQERPDRCQAWSARVTLRQVTEGERVGETELFRLA